MYYLCHQQHTLLSAALYGLHIKQYVLEITDNACDEILESLKQWTSHQSPKNNTTLTKFIDQYEIFEDKTFAGKAGKTAQY